MRLRLHLFLIFSNVAALGALAACELPTTLGDLPTSEATTAMDPGGVSETEPATGGTTSSGGVSETAPPTSSGGVGETAPTTSSGGVGETEATTGSEDVETTSSDEGDSGALDCADLAEAECVARAGCAPSFGVALEFPGCPEGQLYLGCDAERRCEPVQTTVCRDGSEQAYELPNTCVPPGFSACLNLLSICGTPCVDLDQESCEASAVCLAIFGHPHVDDGEGGTCVDDEDSVFLGCSLFPGFCGIPMPTVCVGGDPSKSFDVPSGCWPPFYGSCPTQAGKPACQ